MSKCPICGGECVTPKQEDLDYLTNLLKSNDEFVLMAAYDHFYSYCPSCYIPYEKDYTANQLEALKQKQNELKSIFEDNSFVEFDKNKYALICVTSEGTTTSDTTFPSNTNTFDKFTGLLLALSKVILNHWSVVPL